MDVLTVPPVTHAQARVDLAAVRHNVSLLAEHAGGAELMAVVKADGYGHGAVPVARTCVAAGAARIGTALVTEAIALRDAGITAPILAWIFTPGERPDEALRRDIELSAGALWAIDEIAAAARRTGRTAKVHLKVDTGMSRAGATLDDWPALLQHALAVQAEGSIEITGIWSHLACADTPENPVNERQLAVFDQALRIADKAGVSSGVIRHIANSAATLTLPAARYDMVRPGIAIYGLSPAPRHGDFGLRPAMTLVARLSSVKRVAAGAGVSYGHTYVAERATTLGIVPLGYADGIMRAGSNRLEVLAAGRRRRIAGRVCMDQFAIDLGDDPAEPGDEVILFGPGDHGEPTCQEWADQLGTITYEIVTKIGGRVPRIHIGGR
ncbi:alanine racemase [Thermobispora bispora]|jgi:alanine racemase|uniref:Alanine racemase n=1 Tax=Thermobispora bispora (strain ATCC 19993 / DSM 43833 / CBS 139.67 / JCM 10125 / KCTC 9307 / NBRC 14880 / R51) TaxID=469371 RepID=D6Y561_THEBD|nr:alanine racemase [Thermobispora bispora]MBO2475615.1 alanine racemase [Actinomycetales bacterium]MDI9580160.1 alanine racemase [Thermobispora sp.]ADG87336.1 alanine racemase [Thermobispora bispora DSM 43833]MBX6166785.1 alanine racemase [Thermobispora bispora]QSI47282.1 alanine racemase [Thermobispora bispora]